MAVKWTDKSFSCFATDKKTEKAWVLLTLHFHLFTHIVHVCNPHRIPEYFLELDVLSEVIIDDLTY